MPITRPILAAALSACLAAGAVAQSTSPTNRTPNGTGSQPLKRVEQGAADVNPLRVSNRHLQQNLRVPSDFSEVYEIDPSGGANPNAKRFVRRSGAVYAVFPRSIYRLTDQGLSIPVPPGTIYYIGGLPASLLGSAGAHAAPALQTLTRSDPRVETADVNALAPTGGRASLVRLPRPGDPVTAPPAHTAKDGTSKDDASDADAVPPRAWQSRSSTPGIMDDESERRREVERLLLSLIHRPEAPVVEAEKAAPSATPKVEPASPKPPATDDTSPPTKPADKE